MIFKFFNFFLTNFFRLCILNNSEESEQHPPQLDTVNKVQCCEDLFFLNENLICNDQFEDEK